MDAVAPVAFAHVYEPGFDARRAPLLLLHGTGGDEHDLIGLGRAVAPSASLLSPRGRVLEGAMPRFFRRMAEGIFDEADLRDRTHELADFVVQARQRYGLAAPIAVGFSNGANIAASLLLLRPEVLAGAALLRAMSPFAEPPQAELAGKRVLIASGAMDAIASVENAERLALTLSGSGASVDHRVMPAGHGLSQADIGLLKTWLGEA